MPKRIHVDCNSDHRMRTVTGQPFSIGTARTWLRRKLDVATRQSAFAMRDRTEAWPCLSQAVLLNVVNVLSCWCAMERPSLVLACPQIVGVLHLERSSEFLASPFFVDENRGTSLANR